MSVSIFSAPQTFSLALSGIETYAGASPPDRMHLMDDRLYRLFGSRVRELREEKNVTQDELAKRVDLSRTSITNIERGRQRVLLHQMMEIAVALDAKPTDLIPTAEVNVQPLLRDDIAKVVQTLKAESVGGS